MLDIHAASHISRLVTGVLSIYASQAWQGRSNAAGFLTWAIVAFAPLVLATRFERHVIIHHRREGDVDISAAERIALNVGG
jgi:hypothetical protein